MLGAVLSKQASKYSISILTHAYLYASMPVLAKARVVLI